MVMSLVMWPVTSDARTVVRSGDTVSIGQDQLIEGDLYMAGNIVTVSGQVEEDLLVAAADVNVSGEVGADVLVIGGDVSIDAVVGDDVRILAGEAIISEPILGDVFVIAGNVKILSSATITGDLTIMSSMAEVSGSVDGRILGWAESLRIDSEIKGDVEVTATELTLGDKAVVGGNITYTSADQLIRSQSSTVSGDIVRNDPMVEEADSDISGLLLPLLITLFSVAVWYLLARRSLTRVSNRALAPGIRPVLIGTLVLILCPFAISILLVSMLGLFAGIILLSAYILFIMLALVAMPVVVTQFCYTIFQGSAPPITVLTLLIGTFIVGLFMLTPFVGLVLYVGFFVLTFGALTDLLLRAN